MANSSSADSHESSGLPAEGDTREGPESYHALLSAAVVEFANRGFDGARIEAIARAADYNKSLIYRHFKTKEGLFQAALKFKLDERAKQLQGAPLPLAETMVYWLEQTLGNRDYIRMLMGESLHSDGAPVVDEEWRRTYYEQHIEQIRTAQSEGRYPSYVDPRQIMVMLTSMIFFPAVMPQMARLLTGLTPDSPEFMAGWKKAVDAFAAGMIALATAERAE